MRSNAIPLLAILAVCMPIGTVHAVESPHYVVKREGVFDDSSEKLLQNLKELRAGMTPKEVRQHFPGYVTWRLNAIDRNIIMEVCFQWQDEVFLWASFINTQRTLNGEYYNPDELSDEWKLQKAGLFRKKVKIEDGLQVLVKDFEKPFVTFKYKESKPSEQAGADQPATAPESKSEGKDKSQPESKVAPR